MKVEMHNKLGRPQTVEASRVVIYDCYDNPIMICMEYDPQGGYLYSTADDPQFNNYLRQLGIDKTVVVSDIQGLPLV